MLRTRKARTTDQDKVWDIIRQVLLPGDTYVFAPDSTQEKMLAYWFGADKHTYVAILDDEIIGTCFIKDNQPDLGAHIANAAFMVLPGKAGHGMGRQMGIFVLQEAKRLGYRAMQFNIVVKSNERAVHLWQQLGFKIIGEIPEAFRHPGGDFVNAYIMYQKL